MRKRLFSFLGILVIFLIGCQHTVNKYTLIINIDGKGSVTPKSGNQYEEGTVVKLNPIPDPGWVFYDWDGPDGYDVDNNQITMDENKTITALFIPSDSPRVILQADRNKGHEPLTVNFIADASDPDGDALIYNWNFGDGTTKMNGSANESHVYQTPGGYEAEVTVTDGGNVVSDSIFIEVYRIPTVSLKAYPENGAVGTAIEFYADGYDECGKSLTYLWNFGDGTIITGTSGTEFHTYTNPGSYTVTVQVSDGEITFSDSIIVNIIINHAPIISSLTAQPTSGSAPLEVLFNVSASDPDGHPLNYSWDFGDGFSTLGEEAMLHEYQNPGNYTVTVWVWDIFDAETSGTIEINVIAP